MYLQAFFGDGGSPHPCASCQDDQRLDFDVRMAFQPIVDARDQSIWGYEALVRAMDGGGAAGVIERVRPEQRYRFDQTCRVKAISTAARLGLRQRLAINFFPNAVYEPATCIRLTLAAARMCNFPSEQLVFEMAESERVVDKDHVARIFRDYRDRGFLTAIDDFGAGYAGLTMLANFQPDILKLDMALVRGIDSDPVRLAIVSAVVAMSTALGCTMLAEGVETEAEFHALRALGIALFQGYLFGRPVIDALEPIDPALWAGLLHAPDASQAAGG